MIRSISSRNQQILRFIRGNAGRALSTQCSKQVQAPRYVIALDTTGVHAYFVQKISDCVIMLGLPTFVLFSFREKSVVVDLEMLLEGQ